MFFEEPKINDKLNCEKCKHRFDEPRMLPCGKTICKECSSTVQINQNRFKCILCEKNHFIDDDGLPLNQIINDLLLETPVKVSRGKSADILKNFLKRIESDIHQIPNLLNNPIDYMKEYCIDLENEVQLAKEEIIQDAEVYHQMLSEKINEYKIDCISKIDPNQKLDEKNTKNSENLVKELKLFNEKWSGYLRNTSFDDTLLCSANELGQKLVEKSNDQKDVLERQNFDRLLVFDKCEAMSMNMVIGLVKKRVLCCPLTFKQEKELFKLCNLNPDDNWSLIYQATRDGFLASDFHSKCDSKTNTLVVIKSTNGNIFGGYTQYNWSGGLGYKNDPNAFVFSLINKDNKPICIKTSKPENAINCNAKYGPTFGTIEEFRIFSNSNTVNSSYSNLGYSFLHPFYTTGSNEAKSFLAGSYNFLTLEISVFSKN